MNKTIKTPAALVSHTPRNRQPLKLPVLRIEIHWVGGMSVYNPNTISIAGQDANYPFGQPFKDHPSILSKKPGYLYKSHDLEIPLTLDEIDRFLRLNLRPGEVSKLIETYGIFHEVHDDFYSQGKSLQSRPKSPDFTLAKRRIEVEKLRVDLDAEVKIAPLKPRKPL